MKNKVEYKKMSDDELLKIINIDEKAIDFLLEKYKGLVKSKAKTLFLIGGDRDDLIQEGMIGLYKAIRDYDSTRDTSFYSFANLCISRQIYNAIKASNRKKNIPLNTYISLSSPAFFDEEGEETSNIANNIIPLNQQSIEEMIIDKENANMIEYELVSALSSLEKEVLELYLKDYTYTEIGKLLSKKPKTIDNALTRIKIKLNKIINKK